MDYRDLNAAIGLELPEREALAVMSELSALVDDVELCAKAKELTRSGSSVIRVAISVFLYDHENVRDPGEVSQIQQNGGIFIARSIYDRFLLKNLIIEGNTVRHGKDSLDIAFKLIGAIYRNLGFLVAYDFIMPFMIDIKRQSVKNSKQVIQEYAQGMHLPFSYRVSSSGPAHQLTFTCTLNVNGREAKGTGRSKKEAETNAASTFISTYGIRSGSTPKKTVVLQQRHDSITRSRESQCAGLARSLNLPPNSISIEQLDQALTHASYQAVNSEILTNVSIHPIGSYVLDLLSFDFSHELSERGIDTDDGRRTQLLTDEQLSSALPSAVLRAIKAGPSYTFAKNNNYDRVKATFAKSVLACMWLNYCREQDGYFLASAREFAYGLFAKGKTGSSGLFRTSLQAVVQKYGFGYEEDYHERVAKAHHNPIYDATVTVRGRGWVVRGNGAGATKKSARNRALRTVVTELYARYPYDETLLYLFNMMQPEMQAVEDVVEPADAQSVEISPVEPANTQSVETGSIKVADAKGVEPMEGASSEQGEPPSSSNAAVEKKKAPRDDPFGREAIRNARARKPIVVKRSAVESRSEQSDGSSAVASVISTASNAQGDYSRQSDTSRVQIAQPSSSKHQRFEEVSFVGPERVLHICKGTRSCASRGHNIVCVTGIFTSFNGYQIRMNVNYCNECDLYFLGYREYLHYRDSCGAVLGNYVFDQRSFGYVERGYDSFAGESILMAYGYTVSAAQDLSPQQRRLILANLMDRGICGKARIIDYLQMFIAQREGMWNMRFACEKWRDDLAWVRDYRVDSQRSFTIAAVRRFR